MMQKVLVIDVAALGAELLQKAGVTSLCGLPITSLRPVFPAVTCTAQATLRTALSPAQTGMTSNGVYLRETYQSLFWCQSSNLVHGPRIWDDYRARGGRVGVYFFQQSLGESVDEIVSPAPIHCHGGKMIMATYQQPERVLGCDNPVALWRYWGPLASPKVGRGIASALAERIDRGDAPECLFVYLPTLDYELQRYGTHHRKVAASVTECLAQLEQLVAAGRRQGYAIAIVGDYAITDTQPGGVCLPNLALRQAGLFAVRPIRAMRYPDFYQSRTFALCDHQVADIYCLDKSSKEAARQLLEALPQVARVVEGAGEVDFTLEAKPGCWFAWPWWTDPKEAPDYTTHVDIHNKPGFDPCELFFGRTPMQSSTRTERIGGTHGRDDAPVALATSWGCTATTSLQFAQSLQTLLNS